MQLQPPVLPPVPGGFQFQRHLFFKCIGATAFTLAPWQAAKPVVSGATIQSRLDSVRRNISDGILATLLGDAGEVAMALITGEQSSIRDSVQEDCRASGHAHLLSFSGLSVLAVRAFLMVAAVLVTVLHDRRALSLRSVSWAALVVLVFFPEALTGPSFQMSFLAVIALVAIYEHYTLQPTWHDRDGRWLFWKGA